MAKSWRCCLLVLVLLLAALCSDAGIISKSVCIGDSVQVFQNITSASFKIKITLYKTDADKYELIAVWIMENSSKEAFIQDKYKTKVLFESGTILILNFQSSDEAIYTIFYDIAGWSVRTEVQIIALVAPNINCKPRMEVVGETLRCSFEGECHRPPSSIHWETYTDKPVRKANQLSCCIVGPSLRCARRAKADYCWSFRIDADEKLIPKIYLVQRNIADVSIVLQCQSDSNSTGRFHWRRNGFQIISDGKYSQTDDSLSIRYLKADDQYVIYTCMESGSRFESDPYSIQAYGPTFIKMIQNIMLVKEHDTLNVSCIADCYPFCSVEWSKLDPSSGQKNVLLENDALQITDIIREMSGNYSCKVQNPISGEFRESSLSLNVLYGPDDIFFNTSNNIIKVDEFDSITILCTAECFPPCLIDWIETYTRNFILGAELKLVNVSTNGTYTCRARNPKGTTAAISETVSIQVEIDTTLIPRIAIVRYNVSDSSVVLQCRSFRMSTGKFSWMINGSRIQNSDRYSTDNFFLSIRHVTAEDQYNSYTCKEPGSNLHSGSFAIKASGPTFINVNPNSVVVKEHDGLNVSCLADCYPLCYLQWNKLDPSTGHKNVLSEENALQITHITRDRSGNYSCKVQNIITGAFNESSISVDVLYGPDEVVLNTSNSIAEVYKFSSITVFCSADCFPPCLFRWTFSNTNIIIEGAELKIGNLTSNVSLTCHATNPINMNATVSETIDIMVKSEDIRHTTSSIDQDQDAEATSIHVPSIPYVVYVIPGIAGIGLIVGVVFCFMKKYIHCPRVAGVSNNNLSSHSDVGESLQVETLSQHYWTIDTNARGEFSTALERDNNVELGEFVDPAYSDPTESDESINPRHQNPEELEAYNHPFNSDPTEIEGSYSDSVELEGYIDPIPSDHTRLNEYLDLIPSDPVEFNEYIHPIPSDSVNPGGIIDPIPSDPMKINEYLDLITSDPMGFNEYIHPIPSDPMDLDRYIDPIPSDSMVRNCSIDSIPSDPGERDGYTDPIPSEN